MPLQSRWFICAGSRPYDWRWWAPDMGGLKNALDLMGKTRHTREAATEMSPEQPWAQRKGAPHVSGVTVHVFGGILSLNPHPHPANWNYNPSAMTGQTQGQLGRDIRSP